MANFEADMEALPAVEKAEDFNPRTHGVALMEAQRRLKQKIVGSPLPATSIAGGHITLTEVTKTGVTHHIIHQWPDVAGEDLKVAPYKPRPVMPEGPSVHSAVLDRAAAKRARKAAKLAKAAA